MAHIHLFTSCPESGSSSAGQRIHLFPIASQIFHYALSTSRKRSNSAAQAVRDVFLVAQKVSHETISYAACSTSHYNPPAPALTLPGLFPRKKNSTGNDAIGRPTDIACR